MIFGREPNRRYREKPIKSYKQKYFILTLLATDFLFKIDVLDAFL